MSTAEGIYLSADFRVTELSTRRLREDDSLKFLTVHHPPAEGGPKALLAYTGIARLRDGLAVHSDSVRRSIANRAVHNDAV